MARQAWDHGGTTRHQQGYGTAWNKVRAVVLARDTYLCQPCLAKSPPRPTQATEVDHILGKAKGGTDDPSNLQAICRSCHRDKTIRDRGGRPRRTIAIDGWPIEE